MSANCPHCAHPIKLKTVRAGRFQLKCTRCTQPYLLTVSGDPEPKITASPVAAKAAPVANLEVTAAPGATGGDDADFSISASAAAPANPDVTAALDVTSPAPPAPGRRAAANFEATEAIEEDAPAEEEKEESEAVGDIPAVLGNYQIVKEIGRGGMGAVYLARQVSLDRPVALKVMNARWASNPVFLVRFTREAYAAAQLVHHNVVQVYDIGADKGVNYFSMEFVEGQSLGDLVKKEKKLDGATAAGYVLQAARGLKFAHDRGMIHRDIKPDNLMLNTHGVVKVADLGLVRTPGMEDEQLGAGEDEGAGRAGGVSRRSTGRTLANLSNVTKVGQAMGTPSYMAPEQARDATKVDHRADIYSLGCTLYVMVTGRPVFAGNTAIEVLTKHANEPVVRPDLVVKDVPRGLADVIVKMIAKKPDDRYASMEDVIKALEDFLGLQGAPAKTEQHLRTLEQGVKAFESAGGSALRSYILLGFFGGCAALFALLAAVGVMRGSLGFWIAAGGVLGLGVMTALAYFVVTGVTRKGPLWLKVRDLALSASWLDYAKLGLGLLLTAGVLALLGLLCSTLSAAVFAVVLALGLHFLLDRKVAQQQALAAEKVERMLKTLRLRGISEDAVQEFVAKYAGDNWEGFFEALFGYEAKLQARTLYGKGPKGNRPRFAGWRDPLIRWIASYQRRRQEARERRHLEAIERANLVAQGVGAAEAQRKAEAVADAMVQVAADIRQKPAPPEPTIVTPAGLEATVIPVESAESAPVRPPVKKAPPPRRVNVEEMIRVAAEEPESASPRKGRGFGGIVGLAFGGGVRFLLGAALLAVSLLWLHARGLLPGAAEMAEGWRWKQLWLQGQVVPPLAVPLVPEVVLRAVCSLGALLSGVILILSAMWRSWKIGFAVLLAAALMVVGPVAGVLPPLEFLPFDPALLWLAAGGVVALLGFLFGRDT